VTTGPERLGDDPVRAWLATAAARGAAVPAYDLAGVRPSVVHIGPGVFHRAHQAVYCDDVLTTGSPTGGICAVSLRSADLHHALARQGHLYTLLERDDGGDRARLIGAIRETVVAAGNPQAALRRLTDPSVQVVTITVTEAGYCSAGPSGPLDTSRPEIAHDLAHPGAPMSLPGLLVEALARRRAAGTAPLTVVSCDNLRANGTTTRRVVGELADHRGGDLAGWVRGTVAFPSSMVDRMVPATTEDVRALAAERTGMADAWPVVAEPFSQWVLEDNFPGGRPPWERAGVELVADVAPFEQAKLRILNGAHSALAYLGLLGGHDVIADAVEDAVLRSVVEAMLRHEVVPTLAPPPGLDLPAYAATVLRRFANRPLAYAAAKVAGDGSQKLPVRILGTVADRLAAGARVERLALVVAAWATCVLGPRSGELRVRDPELERLLESPPAPVHDAAVAVDRLLGLDAIFGPLGRTSAFADAVRRHAASLWREDVHAAAAACR
jgi:fructuronate reductase